MIAAGGDAYARNPEAEALFRQGKELIAQGNLVPACEAFEASNRLEPGAGVLIWLGQCREQNHQLASAWSSYKTALARAKTPANKTFAEARIAALEPRLSYLTVTIRGDNRVRALLVTRNGAPIDPAVWNLSVPVDGGDHVIAAHAPGFEDWTTTVAVPVESGRIVVEVPRLEAPAAPAAPAVPALVPPTAVSVLPPPTPARPPPSPWTPRRKLALGAASAGAAGLAAGVAFAVLAGRSDTAARAQCPNADVSCAAAHHANDLINQSGRRALGANISFGIAALAGLGAGILWFTGGPETTSHGAATPAVSLGANGVAVSGRF